MWRPLITDLTERARIDAVVQEIVESLAGAPPGTHPVAAHCSKALLHAYVSRDDSAILEHVSSALSAQAASPGALGLHGGLASVGWTIAHLASDENAEELCVSIDAALLGALDTGCYDLISGLVGFGVYALERGDAGHELATRILAVLSGSAEARGAGLAWKTPPDQLPMHQLAEAPEGYWNLGVAHGIPGIVAFCARCIAYGVEERSARELLAGGVRYLLDVAPQHDSGRFAAWQLPNGTCVGDRNRLAWCYGDLGVAASLLAAATVEPEWEQEARTLARACASRDRSSISDIAICHGAAGIAHAFNRMYQATGDDVLAAAARRWLAITLERRNELTADDPTLVSGAVGVALVCHAMTSEVEPLWDRLLLLDSI